MIALFALLPVVLALAWIWRLARLDEPSRGRWLLRAADICALLALLVLVTRWDIVGLHTRTLILAATVVTAGWSFWRHRRRSARSAVPWRRSDLVATLTSVALMVGLAGFAATGMLPPRSAIPLACPLAGDGGFMVVQGGGNQLVNHHAGHPEQARAVDIVAVGPLGFRAAGLLPRDVSRYRIWGAPVLSPCAGDVVEAVDGLPDLEPPKRDPAAAAGNHVVLACGAVTVELAHLERGSVAVAAGGSVAPGDRLGRVGNSGNTTEPHLHLHAADAATGRAVAVRFGGVDPVRGRRLDC
ncbi:hypothetical protein HNP73_003758 [Amaricoccus macauensis]|uniref:M23ase beta-sheet core domain-containing protein n=1 Tax=Amaricoccus macauensis TaxID=57001 RepID=A0A840SRR2_9RHOB|nr:M23 family metallopeptidase [Amaricoccus macauensis]MBB5223804.1 hypothetical protein [Amaricoccus macauensis]